MTDEQHGFVENKLRIKYASRLVTEALASRVIARRKGATLRLLLQARAALKEADEALSRETKRFTVSTGPMG